MTNKKISGNQRRIGETARGGAGMESSAGTARGAAMENEGGAVQPFSKIAFLAIGSVILLLAVAVVVSWIPGLIMAPFASSGTELAQGNTSTQGGAGESAQLSQATQCSDYLTSGSEEYSYSYLSTLPGMNLTSTLNSTLSLVFSQGDGAVYVRTTEVKMPLSAEIISTGISPIESMWIISRLNSTFGCMSMEAFFDINGSMANQTLECGEGVEDKIEICKDTLNEAGMRTITVPAGTFMCMEYIAPDNSTVCMADIPVPIIVSSSMTVMELQSYEEVVK